MFVLISRTTCLWQLMHFCPWSSLLDGSFKQQRWPSALVATRVLSEKRLKFKEGMTETVSGICCMWRSNNNIAKVSISHSWGHCSKKMNKSSRRLKMGGVWATGKLQIRKKLRNFKHKENQDILKINHVKYMLKFVVWLRSRVCCVTSLPWLKLTEQRCIKCINTVSIPINK